MTRRVIPSSKKVDGIGRSANFSRMIAYGQPYKPVAGSNGKPFDSQQVLAKLDPGLIDLNRQATEDYADIDLQAAEEHAADSRAAADRQNQLALALANQRRAPGGGLVMGGGTRRGGIAIGQASGGLSRANAESLRKARAKNIAAKTDARTQAIMQSNYGTLAQRLDAGANWRRQQRSALAYLRSQQRASGLRI